MKKSRPCVLHPDNSLTFQRLCSYVQIIYEGIFLGWVEHADDVEGEGRVDFRVFDIPFVLIELRKYLSVKVYRTSDFDFQL